MKVDSRSINKGRTWAGIDGVCCSVSRAIHELVLMVCAAVSHWVLFTWRTISVLAGEITHHHATDFLIFSLSSLCFLSGHENLGFSPDGSQDSPLPTVPGCSSTACSAHSNHTVNYFVPNHMVCVAAFEAQLGRQIVVLNVSSPHYTAFILLTIIFFGNQHDGQFILVLAGSAFLPPFFLPSPPCISFLLRSILW